MRRAPSLTIQLVPARRHPDLGRLGKLALALALLVPSLEADKGFGGGILLEGNLS